MKSDNRFKTWAVVLGQYSDPGPIPAHPGDCDRDQDSKARDSPDTKIPRDNKSRHFALFMSYGTGTGTEICSINLSQKFI